MTAMLAISTLRNIAQHVKPTIPMSLTTKNHELQSVQIQLLFATKKHARKKYKQNVFLTLPFSFHLILACSADLLKTTRTAKVFSTVHIAFVVQETYLAVPAQF